MVSFLTNLPQNLTQWLGITLDVGLNDKTLRSCRNLRSGSKVTDEQFVLCRVICPEIGIPANFDPPAFGLTQADLLNAAAILASNQDFQNFKANLSSGNWAPTQDLGVFQTSQMQKFGITPLVSRSAPDEAKVNTSFLNFLNAIASLVQGGDHLWNAFRKGFTARFGRVRGDPKPRQFVAYVDGELQDRVSQDIKAIVECKKVRRREGVARQEVAEIVAWINESPDQSPGPVNRRISVSEDADQVYMSALTYGPEWMDYIRRCKRYNVTTHGLATFNTFGPWYIDRPHDLEGLAVILLAIIQHS